MLIESMFDGQGLFALAGIDPTVEDLSFYLPKAKHRNLNTGKSYL
jgi:hypothetical protein